jgi:hypothetical protein
VGGIGCCAAGVDADPRKGSAGRVWASIRFTCRSGDVSQLGRFRTRRRAGWPTVIVAGTLDGACGGGLDWGVGEFETVRDDTAVNGGVDDLETVREDTADDAGDTVGLGFSTDGTLCNKSRRSCIAAIHSRRLWASSSSGEAAISVVDDRLEFLVGTIVGVTCSTTPRGKAVRNRTVHFLTISSTWS